MEVHRTRLPLQRKLQKRKVAQWPALGSQWEPESQAWSRGRCLRHTVPCGPVVGCDPASPAQQAVRTLREIPTPLLREQPVTSRAPQNCLPYWASLGNWSSKIAELHTCTHMRTYTQHIYAHTNTYRHIHKTHIYTPKHTTETCIH